MLAFVHICVKVVVLATPCEMHGRSYQGSRELLSYARQRPD